MNYPKFGNVSLGSVSGNIKLFVNEGGVNNLTGIGYNNNSMTFGVNQSAFAIPEMVINQSGNVGIGTTNPIYTLDINGNVRSTDLRIDNGNIHLGQNAGLTNQGANCVAIGFSAGSSFQGIRSIAIGDYAGTSNQGINSIAIGRLAIGTGGNSIAIGSGASTGTGGNSIAIGSGASTGIYGNSVAIGAGAIAGADNQITLGTMNEKISIPCLVTISQSVLTYTTSFTLSSPYSQTYMLNPTGAALTTSVTITITGSTFPNGTIINFRKIVNGSNTIILAVTSNSFVPYNTVSGTGGTLLTSTQMSTAIVFYNNNVYQMQTL